MNNFTKPGSKQDTHTERLKVSQIVAFRRSVKTYSFVRIALGDETPPRYQKGQLELKAKTIETRK